MLLAGLCLLPWESVAQSAGATDQTDTTESPRYVTQQWTVADGLPVNAVSDVTQTEDGYLWLATFDGLVRFDGAQFTVY